MLLLVPLVLSTLVVWVTANSFIIDVSHYNGKIDWKKAKAAGVVAAIAKVSEGNHNADHTFVENWQGMKKHGIKQLGVYHYLRGGQSAESQVALIKSCLKKVDFDANQHFVAIDVEEKSNKDVTADKMADALKGVIEKLKPTYNNIYIYTAPSMENKVSWNKYYNDFRSCNLWIAHYNVKAPRILKTWVGKDYKLWQYSQTGKLKGFTNNFDLNKWKQ